MKCNAVVHYLPPYLNPVRTVQGKIAAISGLQMKKAGIQ